MKVSFSVAALFAALAVAVLTRVLDEAAGVPQPDAAEVAADSRTVKFINHSGRTVNYRKFLGSTPGDKGTPGTLGRGEVATFPALGAAQVIKASFGDPSANPVYQFEWTLDTARNVIVADLSGKDSGTMFNGYKRSLLFAQTQEPDNAGTVGCHNLVCKNGQTGPPCEYRTDHDLDNGTPTCPLGIEGSGTILTFKLGN